MDPGGWSAMRFLEGYFGGPRATVTVENPSPLWSAEKRTITQTAHISAVGWKMRVFFKGRLLVATGPMVAFR